jgi:hypothetical protein
MATTKRAQTRKTTDNPAEPSSKPAGSPRSDVTTVTTRSEDVQKAIRERAYEIYKQRGGHDGTDLEDWVEAEREISERSRRRTP